MRNIITILVLANILLLIGCAGHSTISPDPLKKGESYYAFNYSLETGVPSYVFRKGITNLTDFGVRIGLPLYGSGMDISRILTKEGDTYYLLNVGYSWALNPGYDFTLYRMTKIKRRPGLITYYGLRGMMIPDGISNRESIRIGFILGNYTIGKWGYEIGYFHDFSSMPLADLTSFEVYKPEGSYVKFPHSINGFPSEHSRMTGLSVRINIPLNEKQVRIKKRKKSP